MRRVIVFFIAVIALLGFSYHKTCVLPFEECEKVVVVCNEMYENLDKSPIKNGGDYYHILSGEKIEFFKDNMSMYEYKGISLYFNSSYSVDYFKTLCLNNLYAANNDNYQIYYGYYPGFNDAVTLNGKKINIQLAKTNEGWIAGFPLILTGF